MHEISDNSLSDDESEEEDDYSDNDDKFGKFGDSFGEVRGSRTNCKGHWSKEEVSLIPSDYILSLN
jgi:hypothetical protein